jgi:hypothetical protein
MPSPYDPRQSVKVGGALYVQSRNTRMMESPSNTANAIAILQPRTMVTWLGAVPGEPRWHRVRYGGRTGVVFASNLALRPPEMALRVAVCKTCDGSGAVPKKDAPPVVCAFEPCAACRGTGLPGGKPRQVGPVYANPGVAVRG